MQLSKRLAALMAPARSPWNPDRVVALDVARMIALAGMFSEHLLMGQAPGAVLVLVTGFPSTMFAVLGGFSVAVSTRRLVQDGRIREAFVSVAVRGLMITAIGLVLGAVPLVLVMVLAYYGSALIAVAFVVGLPTWVLATAAAALSLGSPHLILWARQTGEAGAIPSPSFADPLEFLQTLIFTGFYPAITWFTYMLIGLCAGRLILFTGERRAPVAIALTAGALMFTAGSIGDAFSRPAVIELLGASGLTAGDAHELITNGYGTPLAPGWLAVLSGTPHTGTTADILRTAGIALAVVSVLLLVIPVRPPIPIMIIARAGSAPLSIYLLHFFGFYAFLLVAVLLGDSAGWLAFGPVAIAIHVSAALAIGAYLWFTNRRGPLEAFVSRTVRAVSRRIIR